MHYKMERVGSDAEVFLIKNGATISVEGLLGGTKENPRSVLGGNGFAVQEDCVAAEFNIPACETSAEFVASMGKMVDYLMDYFRPGGIGLYPLSLGYFDPVQMRTPQATTMGCEPDFNVWTKAVQKPTPESFGLSRHLRNAPGVPRCSGFHIHVSYRVDGEYPTKISQIERVIKAHDLFVGMPSVFLPIDRSSETLRRQFYGSAGSFRPKDYGHEYRVLGGSLTPNAFFHKVAFDRTKLMFEWLNEMGPDNADSFLNKYKDYITTAINACSVDHALVVISNMVGTKPEYRTKGF